VVRFNEVAAQRLGQERVRQPADHGLGAVLKSHPFVARGGTLQVDEAMG
jgi:hypothetical protein